MNKVKINPFHLYLIFKYVYVRLVWIKQLNERISKDLAMAILF